MTTREGRLLKTSMVLALALLVCGPLASFAGSWGVSVGVGVAAPGPGYVWVPGCYDWRPVGGYAWVPGRWALPPYAGAVWVGPRWGWYGHHRNFVHGYWRHAYYHPYHRGYWHRGW
jgi:hypothetical protein